MTKEEARKERKRENQRRYYAKNREKCIAATMACHKKNPERTKETNRRYVAKNKDKVYETKKRYLERNPGKAAQWKREWVARNREKVREYHRDYCAKRRKTPLGKVERLARSAMHRALKAGGMKDESSLKYFGCTKAELRAHIESQFQPGMTWENHGKFTWHVDHIRPLCTFDMTNPDEMRKALHYTNLQPLPASQNLGKPKSITPAATNNLLVGVDKPNGGLN